MYARHIHYYHVMQLLRKYLFHFTLIWCKINTIDLWTIVDVRFLESYSFIEIMVVILSYRNRK